VDAIDKQEKFGGHDPNEVNVPMLGARSGKKIDDRRKSDRDSENQTGRGRWKTERGRGQVSGFLCTKERTPITSTEKVDETKDNPDGGGAINSKKSARRGGLRSETTWKEVGGGAFPKTTTQRRRR